MISPAYMVSSAYIERILARFAALDAPLIVVADSRWGAPYALEGLRAQGGPLVWLSLNEQDALDVVAQGNKLSDAVTRALGSQLFGHGMPYSYGLSRLRDTLGLLEPLTLALSGADHGQALAGELLGFQRSATQVVLHFETLPTELLIPETAVLWQEQDLELLEAEALAWAAGRLGEVEVRNLWRLTRGAPEAFGLELHRRLSLPAPLRPGPGGPELPPGSESGAPPEVLYGALRRRGQYLELLELSATHLPERVPEALGHAGEAYLERGLYRRLFELLAQTSGAGVEDERLLTWHLRAAKRLGRVEELRARTEAFLAEHEAPDLRATYATTLAGRAGFAEVERAYGAERTPITLQHYGLHLTLEDPEASLAVFRDLLELSRAQPPTQQVLAAMLLAPPLLVLGRYKEAAQWLEEALSRFDQHGLGDWQARMHIVNNWAYTRILIGETVGLSEILQQEARALRGAYPALAFSFRSTLGDYLLSQGRAREALPFYQENLDILTTTNPTQGRDLPPHLTRDVIHCLLHLGETSRAGNLALRRYRLDQDAAEPMRSFALLGQGMVLALENPPEAIAILEGVRQTFEDSLSGDHLASSSFYLARGYLALGREADALGTLERAERVLHELSDTGFRLLAGPEAQFREVYRLWRGKDIPLHLELLGQPSVRLDGRPLTLWPQWHDVLALLASAPGGLSSEQLLSELYGDAGNPDSLKASLSKLRRHLPLSRPPYRLELPFQADFLELEQRLREGRLRAALELYQGPLLPHSKSPGVQRLQEMLEESLRRTVLGSGDPEALLSLAERLGEDLELWEAALAALPQQDPRHALAAARHKKLLERW